MQKMKNKVIFHCKKVLFSKQCAYMRAYYSSIPNHVNSVLFIHLIRINTRYVHDYIKT